MQNWMIGLLMLLLFSTSSCKAVNTGLTENSPNSSKFPFISITTFKLPDWDSIGLYVVKPVELPDGTILMDGNNDSNWLSPVPPDQIFNPKTNEVSMADFQVTGDYIGDYRFLETDWRCMKPIGDALRAKCLESLGHIYDLKNKTVTTLNIDKNAKTIAKSLDHFHGHRDGCGASEDMMFLRNYHRLEFNCVNENGQENTYVREFDPSTDTFIEYKLPHLKRKNGIYLELNNGQVLIMGGVYPFFSAQEGQTRPEVELFDPKTKTIKTVFNLNTPPRKAWQLKDGRILIQGVNSLETVNLETGQRKLIDSYKDSLDMSVFLSNGNLLFAGNGKDVLVFDAKLSKLKKIGQLPKARRAPLLSLEGGKRVYLFGGYWCGEDWDCKFKREIYNDILEFSN